MDKIAAGRGFNPRPRLHFIFGCLLVRMGWGWDLGVVDGDEIVRHQGSRGGCASFPS
jgi:hypothetical protein